MNEQKKLMDAHQAFWVEPAPADNSVKEMLSAFWKHFKTFDFWDWLNATENEWGLLGFPIRVIVLISICFLAPIITYNLVRWDPCIGANGAGTPVKLGEWVVNGLFWIAIYISYKRHKTKNVLIQRNIELIQLLDKVLDENGCTIIDPDIRLDAKEIQLLFAERKSSQQWYSKLLYRPTRW
jgi:hypothetical protein